MFIREVITNNKNGAKYVTHRLIEAYRTDDGPRQRIIMHLGFLPLQKAELKILARLLEARISCQPSLFEDNPELALLADQAMMNYDFNQLQKDAKAERLAKQELLTIDLSSVNTSASRSLGPELVAHAQWEQLHFDKILSSCGFTPAQRAMAEAAVVGRLVNPTSDLGTWNWLKNETALTELLPDDTSSLNKNAMYEVADQLFHHKNVIERALHEREGDLFPTEHTVFLYDLTNTYLEGSCLSNPLAKRAKSKEKRSDCKLVTLALVVDSRGFPVFSQVYEGNQSEPQTLTDILDRLDLENQGLFAKIKPTVIMDRGIATIDNIKLLKDREYPYVVIERRAVEKDYLDEFNNAKETFEKIMTAGDKENAAVYVKKISHGDEGRVLCLSEGREQKEMAIDKLKEERFLHDLTRLKSSVLKRSIMLIDKVSERFGRLKERYPSIAQYYEVKLELDEAQKKVIGLTWDKKENRDQREALTGCYVISTSHQNMAACEIWKMYMTLTQVENAFRALKTDLGLRPVRHQLPERTQAHLFISVLAYHLLISIEHQLREKGDHRSFATIRTQLKTHQRSTVIMTDKEDLIHHIRVSGTPESVHKEIYRLLNVKDTLKRLHHLAGKRL